MLAVAPFMEMGAVGAGMFALITALFSLLVWRFRSRARRRRQPGRPKLTSMDRLLRAWLFRVWPRRLEVVVLVKSTTVVQGVHGPDSRERIAKSVT